MGMSAGHVGTVEMVRAGCRMFAVRVTRGGYTIGQVKGPWEPELGQVVHGNLESQGDIALRVGLKDVQVTLLASACSRSAAWEMLT